MPTRSSLRGLVLSLPLVLLTAAAAAPQTRSSPDLTTLSLEDLLSVEVISTASKFRQDVREAPASTTVVTGEDIRRYGHRTLADTLRSVRGFYTTYDRNYSYIGMRGFGRPGDYNTRILLLLDGHRLNDGVYGMAPLGTDFPIDVSLIDRVEIIRGPGSSLYGTSALFAVINVVTRTGALSQGFRVDTTAGSFGTYAGAASYGQLFGSAGEFLVSGTGYRSAGQQSLFYPEFADGDPGGGIATDLDHDRAANVFASVDAGRLSFRGGAGHRRKQIPTASYETAFGDGREATADDRAFLDATYDGPLFKGWSGRARLAYDYYGYQGVYPGDDGTGAIAPFDDASVVHTLTGEVLTRRRLAKHHLVTIGAEVRHQLRNRQWAHLAGGATVDVSTPGTNGALYAQDEVRISSWLLGNVGFRVDSLPGYGTYATPRAGIVLLPRQQTAIKLLYGRAFRAPSAYEVYYYPLETVPPLSPERIGTSEVVWEESLSKSVRTAVTAFAYDADRIIEQQQIPGGTNEDLIFANAGEVRGLGVEAELEARLPNQVSARLSHTYSRVRNRMTETTVSNSPSQLSKLSVQIPVSRLFLAVEGQYVGERQTLQAAPLPGFFMANIVLTSPADRPLSFTLGVYNALNEAYADPGAEEHLQDALPQDGRSVLARLHVRF